MRVISATIVLLFVITIAGVALLEPLNANGADADDTPGIYCYDYFFSGNQKSGLSFFSKVNPNASFMDTVDKLQYKLEDKCNIYSVSGQGRPSLFDLYFDEVQEINYSTDSTKILPNPGVMFIDEENIDFQKFSSGDTVLYGGVLPFVALPDGDLETEDSFFNEESFSLFLYFKTKF